MGEGLHAVRAARIMIKLIDNTGAFDTETTGLWPYQTEFRKALGLGPDQPFMFIVANTDGDAVQFRGRVNKKTRVVTYDNCRSELRWLKNEVVDNPKVTLAMHNAPFDVRMTIPLGFQWRCRVHDTRVMARVSNPTTEYAGYDLKYLSNKYLGIPSEDLKALKKYLNQVRMQGKRLGWRIATKETHGKRPAEADYWLPGLEHLVEPYGLTDGIRTIGLYLLYLQILKQNKADGGKLLEVYEWERRVQDTAIRMEGNGMTYLSDAGAELGSTYRRYMRKQKLRMAELGYGELNPQSPKQLNQIFIEDMGRETEKRTNPSKTFPDGNPKIDAEQLMAWARGSAAGADVDGDGPDGCKLSRALLEWKAGKKVTEYITSYEFFKCMRPDGSTFLHPAWDTVGARTGRFSCHDPNTQQIASAETSRRHSLIRARQRECFGPRPGYVWYMPDYSQIEVWIFAFAAKEKVMMRALLSGEDFHLATATQAWGKRKDFCTCGAGVGKSMKEHQKGCLVKWWRQRAKMILFSRLYGGGIGKISQLIRCDRDEAEEFVNEFNDKLPGVRRYMDTLIDEVERTGRLVNLFGREYIIDSDRSYKAVNYMVQGSAAEVMKRALVRVDQHLIRKYSGSYVVGTVHDELIAEIMRAHHSRRLMREIIRIMQIDSHFIPNMPVPLPVGMKWASVNWSLASEVDIDPDELRPKIRLVA